MPARPFLPWPDKRLRTAAAEVPEITGEIRAIWEDMVASMEAMPGQGVGLAAPQIGVGLRLAVVDASLERGQVVRMANPEVIDASTEMNQHDEASPNLPGVSTRITRPARVLVRYMDAHGMLVRKDFEGLWATSVQHQIDHLDGRMYFDRLSKVKRDMLLRKAAKLGGAG